MVAAVIQFQAAPVRSTAATIGHQRIIVVDNALRVRRNSFAFERRYTSTSFPSSSGRRFVVAASKSPNQDANSSSSMSQDDLSYLLKLGGGSIVGAAAIKYGSILVPEITRPNVTQALIMIFTPVLVAVLILIKQSSVER